MTLRGTTSAIALALTLLACQSKNPPAPLAEPLAALKPARKADTSAGLVGLDGATLVGLDGATLIGLDGATLVGLDGATLIGLDGATLKGQLEVPSSLIGLDGATLIGLDGATYRLSQAQTAPKRTFAGVSVYLRTADGKFVVGKDSKLLTAKTDAEGNFSFPNLKAEQPLFFYVPLGKRGGDLYGLAGLRTPDTSVPTLIDEGSSLMSAWLERHVLISLDNKAESLGRLPDTLARETQAKLKEALGSTLDFKRLDPAALASQVQTLENNTEKDLADTLDEVRRLITLAGVDACQDENDALKIALRLPRALATTPDGSLFVSEAYTGTVYRLDPDGRRTFVLGTCAPGSNRKILADITHLLAADGWLYMVPNRQKHIFKARQDGTEMAPLVGGGIGPAEPGAAGATVGLFRPGAVARAKDGNLWIADGRFGEDPVPPRLFKVDPDGNVVSVHTTPWDGLPQIFDTVFFDVTETEEGLWFLAQNGEMGLYFQPKNGAWRKLDIQFPAKIKNTASLLAMPDQSVLLSLADSARQRHVIERIWSDGRMERFAGKGTTGVDDGVVQAADAQFNIPAGLALALDGRVIVADYDNGLLRAIHPETKEVRIIAGSRGARDAVARNEALSGPTGLTVDNQGRIFLSEFGAHTIRRLNGDRLERVAGGVAGNAPDDTMPDRLMGPSSIAAHGNDLVVMEATSRLIRRIRNIADPNAARIETLAGVIDGPTLEFLPPLGTPVPAREKRFAEIGPMTVDPEGRVVFASLKHSETPTGGDKVSDCIWRIEPDGTLLRLVGSSDKSHPNDDARAGKLGSEVRLTRPTSLAYDPQGNLYFTDFQSAQVLKLGRDNRISIVAGSGLIPTLAAATNGSAAAEQDVPAREASLLVPSGLAVASDGTLFIAELGTTAPATITSVEGMNLSMLPKLSGRIRMLTPEGRLKTVAGLGAPGGLGEVRAPATLALTTDGRLLYIDLVKNQLQELKLKP